MINKKNRNYVFRTFFETCKNKFFISMKIDSKFIFNIFTVKNHLSHSSTEAPNFAVE